MRGLAVACGLIAPLLIACGGGNTGSPTATSSAGNSIVIVLHASSAASTGATLRVGLQKDAEAIKNRLDERKVSGEVKLGDDDSIVVSLQGSTLTQDVLDLISQTGLVNFREPIVDKWPDVKCQTSDGLDFSVNPNLIHPTAGSPAQCQASGVQFGPVQWQPAADFDSTGAPRVLTGNDVQPKSVQVLTQGMPALNFAFNSEGSLVFQEITTRLARGHMPLGFFIDDNLMTAPKVQTAIVGGQTQINGSTDELENMAAYLKYGPLELPLAVTASPHIGPTSPPPTPSP